MKVKTGYCIECGNTEPKPIIGKLCNFHYWRSKAKPIIRKPQKIKPVSDKRNLELAKYRIARDQFFKENPCCIFPGCSVTVVDLHHAAGKIGKLLYDKNYFRSLCRKHHIWVEERPVKAKELGLSVDRL